MNHQICGSSISAANQKSTALVIIGSGAVQPRPSRLHVIKRATRMPLIPIPSSPDSARSKLVLDSSSCLNSPPQAAAKVQIFCSNLHANFIKLVCKGGPKSQGLSSCSLAKLRLNKVAILVNEPLVAEGHDHGLTATQQSPWQSSYGYHTTSHTTHWQREICQFLGSPHPP